ncbi:MAG TPA: alcohol dehydrogenase catalytic domain-containing protein [Bryobacteraceae bacterium]|jgi:alcohol dehydrogenase|nr:alcohol dehydrogenase catalytic domain-containing protein [Bryobacteraceae bacterium]
MVAVCLYNGAVLVREQPRPRRPDGFALIRLLCGGICNTDLELQRGYYGFRGTPGHEFVGEVIAADNSNWIGQRVVGEINLACGACEWCRRGWGRHCPRRSVLGIVKHPGAFREFLTLPEQNLHRVPREISTEEAVFVEPLAAACEILDQVRIPAGAPVAVLGDGKLGLLIGQVLQAHGAEVHLYGHHKDNLRIATALGIDARIGKTTPKGLYDWVVDATGSSLGLAQAVKMTRPRGTVVMKSTVHGLVGIDSAPLIVNEITLVGSRCGRFEPALKLLRTRGVRVDNLISEALPLKKAPLAFRRAAQSGAMKVLLNA